MQIINGVGTASDDFNQYQPNTIAIGFSYFKQNQCINVYQCVSTVFYHRSTDTAIFSQARRKLEREEEEKRLAEVRQIEDQKRRSEDVSGKGLQILCYPCVHPCKLLIRKATAALLIRYTTLLCLFISPQFNDPIKVYHTVICRTQPASLAGILPLSNRRECLQAVKR